MAPAAPVAPPPTGRMTRKRAADAATAASSAAAGAAAAAASPAKRPTPARRGAGRGKAAAATAAAAAAAAAAPAAAAPAAAPPRKMVNKRVAAAAAAPAAAAPAAAPPRKVINKRAAAAATAAAAVAAAPTPPAAAAPPQPPTGAAPRRAVAKRGAAAAAKAASAAAAAPTAPTPPAAVAATTAPAAAPVKAVSKRGAAAKKGAAPKKGAPVTAPAVAAAVAPAAAKTFTVDPAVPGGSSKVVVGEFNAVLNQTQVDDNANKFYRIQVLRSAVGPPAFWCWTHWGRVGEDGQSKLLQSADQDGAEREFRSKFTAKTGNKWGADPFVPKNKKYTLIEVEADEVDPKVAAALASVGAGAAARSAAAAAVEAEELETKLPLETLNLMQLMFDDGMMRDAMRALDIDVEKMPLGMLSQAQVARGYAVLEEIQELLDDGSTSRSEFARLTSAFYTVIPHSFGRQKPPLIDSAAALRAKYDMVAVLQDIEQAQSLAASAQKEKERLAALGGTVKQKVPHPLDLKAASLKATIAPLPPGDVERDVIERYFHATASRLRLLDIFRVDRAGEAARFAAHDGTGNRRLLFHGTNVAVAAAITSSGLRIMPHSGGRVGRGVYLASECDKSAGYLQCAGDGRGVMFLAEGVFGREKHITMDDSSLVTAPPGFDSVVALGQQNPPTAKDTTLMLDGKPVSVPQAKPEPTGVQSSFWQNEFLCYQESQVRLRYILVVKR